MIAGVTDFAAVRFKKTVPDLAKALQNIDMNTKTVILLAHQPRGSLIAQAEEKGVALQLSGHTHGGMILGLDRIIAKMNGGYVRGLYYPGRMALYVNPGSSLWNGFPIRFGIPSEITLIRLSSR